MKLGVPGLLALRLVAALGSLGSALLIGHWDETAADREALTQRAHDAVAKLLEEGNALVAELERG
mgnify:CR=1 FL=1